MSFLAGLTGCCVGLLTKLYSNSLRKLPYMRGKVFFSYFVSNTEYRAMGTCNLYVCGRLLVLLWEKVHCIDIIFKVMDCRITRRILFKRCWSIWIEKMYMGLRNWRKNNLSFCYLLWWNKRCFSWFVLSRLFGWNSVGWNLPLITSCQQEDPNPLSIVPQFSRLWVNIIGLKSS